MTTDTTAQPDPAPKRKARKPRNTGDTGEPKAKAKWKPRRKRKSRAGLTAQEQRFCNNFVLMKNGSEAVATTWPNTRRWKPQTRAEKAYKLLRRSQIKARVAELEAIARSKLNTAFALTAEQVIGRLTLLASGTVRDFIELDEKGQPTIVLKGATAEQLYAVNEVTVEDIDSGHRQSKRTRLKLGDRIAALRLLGQHHQLFTERVEHQHEHVVVIENAARELQQRIALLTSRAQEPVADAEIVPPVVEAEVVPPGEQRAP
jgi:phage terminase small subunit